MKKLLCMLLALVLCLGVFAGCGAEDEPDETKGGNQTPSAGQDGSLFKAEDNVKIQMWMSPNLDLEVPGCYANQAINKVTNATVEIMEYPEMSVYDTAMAEQKVPQLTFTNVPNMITKYGAQGAYINWYEYLELLPNVAAMLEDARWAEDVAKYTYSENVMYGLPVV